MELYCNSNQKNEKKTPKGKNRLSKSELTKRGYEKDGVKELQKEIKEAPIIEPLSPKSPEVTTTTFIDNGRSWHQTKERERKDSTRIKKILTAVKVNEIVKNEETKHDKMVDLKSFKISDSVDEPLRNAITLADFAILSKSKKKSLSFTEPTPAVLVQEILKPAWNMDNVELKPNNNGNVVEAMGFKELPLSSGTKQKAAKSPKQSRSSEKKFTAILKNERKEKDNFEKTKSKSLLLTQIEERAIAEFSEFYNITNIFDEDIKVSRKIQPAMQNLSQWHSGIL